MKWPPLCSENYVVLKPFRTFNKNWRAQKMEASGHRMLGRKFLEMERFSASINWKCLTKLPGCSQFNIMAMPT